MWLPDETCELGVGWERIIFDWMQHQPDDAEQWHTLNVDDRWLKNANLCNREIVALLKVTPPWATEGQAGIGIPLGLDLPINDPHNTWAQFVIKAVTYYQPRGVSHFIIWNEPDIQAGTYGYEFDGDLEAYFQLLKVAYLAAKSVNPSAKIHLAGTTYWHDVNEGQLPYMERLIARILEDTDAVEHDYYFDVASLHIYFRSDTVYTITRSLRDFLDSHGLNHKEIWINETNAAPTDDPNWPVDRPVFQLDLNQQAQFLVQAAALSIASGADRVAAYKLIDQGLPEGAESFGILTPGSYEPRPAYFAWQMLNDHFQNLEAAQYLKSKYISAVLFKHLNGTHSLMLWANTEQAASLDLYTDASKIYQLSLNDNLTIVRPSPDFYNFSLPPAQCTDKDGCFIGGDVLILYLVGSIEKLVDHTESPSLLDVP
ncbi:hypothetical protein MASR2M15_09370 [Anaerolineales bacterium]